MLDVRGVLVYVLAVAGTKKAGGRKSDSSETVPFEAAMTQLEKIVEAMEDGDLPLENLLEKYEEGTVLVRTCQTKLEEAEKKIRKLEKTASGEVSLDSVEPSE